jgi:hypothetical protein
LQEPVEGLALLSAQVGKVVVFGERRKGLTAQRHYGSNLRGREGEGVSQRKPVLFTF